MRARGKETKEHEDSLLMSECRAFSCLFLVVTGPAAPVSAGMDCQCGVALGILSMCEGCAAAGAGRQRWHRLRDSLVSLCCFGSTVLLIPCTPAVNVHRQNVSPWVAQMFSCTSLFHCLVADGCGVELPFGQLVFQGLFQSCLIPLPYQLPLSYQLPLCQATKSHSERTEVPEVFNFLQCC